jgi:hypothetical protein
LASVFFGGEHPSASSMQTTPVTASFQKQCDLVIAAYPIRFPEVVARFPVRTS